MKKILLSILWCSFVVLMFLYKNYNIKNEHISKSNFIINKSIKNVAQLIGVDNMFFFDFGDDDEIGAVKDVISSRWLINKIIDSKYHYNLDSLTLLEIYKNIRPKSSKLLMQDILHSSISFENNNSVMELTVTSFNPYLSIQIHNYILKYIKIYFEFFNSGTLNSDIKKLQVLKDIESKKLLKYEEELTNFSIRNRNINSPNLSMIHSQLKRKVSIQENFIMYISKSINIKKYIFQCTNTPLLMIDTPYILAYTINYLSIIYYILACLMGVLLIYTYRFILTLIRGKIRL